MWTSLIYKVGFKSHLGLCCLFNKEAKCWIFYPATSFSLDVILYKLNLVWFNLLSNLITLTFLTCNVVILQIVTCLLIYVCNLYKSQSIPLLGMRLPNIGMTLHTCTGEVFVYHGLLSKWSSPGFKFTWRLKTCQNSTTISTLIVCTTIWSCTS